MTEDQKQKHITTLREADFIFEGVQDLNKCFIYAPKGMDWATAEGADLGSVLDELCLAFPQQYVYAGRFS